MAGQGMEKQRNEKRGGNDSTAKSRKALSNQSHRIGAVGYGLNEDQQEAIADLWAWQAASLKSNIILGGPLK